MVPDRIHSEAALEDLLAEPSEADIACVSRLDGDVLVLGAGGKMGPSLARRVHRAARRAGGRVRVIAASRFSSASVRTWLEAEGILTVACDLLEPAAIQALPDRKTEIQEMVAEDDRVAVRIRMTGTNTGGFPFLNVPANGNKVDIEWISIYTVKDGKAVDHRAVMDLAGLMQQLNAS